MTVGVRDSRESRKEVNDNGARLQLQPAIFIIKLCRHNPLIEAVAQLYVDEAESSHFNAEPLQYQPQLECDDGIPTTCYCGAEPVVGYSTTRILGKASKDSGGPRLFLK
ncbi:Uncharacterized protein Rs2_10483 [Raphanus sativus]|nr:Uncharacterized protein Rs2_10483 [Raphanus sativus]